MTWIGIGVLKRAIKLYLPAIPVAIVGAGSNYFGASIDLSVGLMFVSAIIACILMEVWK